MDVDLANRLREIVSGEHGRHEQQMFGGPAFPINGALAVAASRDGGLLLGVAPERTDE